MLADKLKGAKISDGWNLARASFNGGAYGFLGFTFANQAPSDVFFSGDGLDMYMTRLSTVSLVAQFRLDAAWDISTAKFVRTLDVSAQEASPAAVFFKPDGTQMYIVGGSTDAVIEYSLSTAWNISTASFVRSFSVSGQDTSPSGLFFSPSGTDMYVLGNAGDDVNQYSLSTAWNISTASYVRNFSVAGQDVTPTGVFFSSDGLEMFVAGAAGVDILQYSLSTAWNISTASYTRNFLLSSSARNPSGVFFRGDGTKMYVSSSFPADVRVGVYSFTLSTAWDISSASWDAPLENYFDLVNEETNPAGLFISPDGSNLYIVGTIGDDVNQYSLSVLWNIATASYVRNFSVSAQDINPQDVFFSPSGTDMYVLGAASDNVIQYSLSAPWDISTASFVRTRSVAAQETGPTGLFFSSDGTRMYLVGTSDDDVVQYDLSTAWDISTLTFVRNFSVSAQETLPTSVFFKPDGTQMYVLGNTGDDVNQYSLSTAWNISTASFVRSFSVVGQDTAPSGLFFNDYGTKMYMVGTLGDAVWSYDL